MKRMLALLLLAALLLCTGCATVQQAADVLGSDEAKDMIKENWNALAGEINEGAQKAKQEVGEALGKVLPDTAHGYTYGGAELPTEGIRKIKVDWVSGAVDIAVYDGDTVAFSEESGAALLQGQQLRYRVEEGELRIVCCENGTINLPRKTLTLNIPAGLALSSLEVEQVSAALTVEGVEAGEIDVETVSGNAVLRDCACRELDVQGVSGAVTLENCAVAGEIDVETVSGSTTLQLPAESAGFTLSYNTVSGTLQCAREVQVEGGRQINGDGSLQIDVETVSGNLSIS